MMTIYKATVTYRVFKGGNGWTDKPMEVEFAAEGDHEALAQLWERFNHAFPGVTGDLAEKFGRERGQLIRSMSVGDEIVLAPREFPEQATRFVVAPMGFDLLRADEENEYARPGGLWNPREE